MYQSEIVKLLPPFYGNSMKGSGNSGGGRFKESHLHLKQGNSKEGYWGASERHSVSKN